MKDTGNPTRWQVAGLALSATVIAAGLALKAPAPRLAVGGEPGGVVRTVDETPERRARLVAMVRRAGMADDRGDQERSSGDDNDPRDSEPSPTAPTGDDPAPTAPAPSQEDLSDQDAPVEEDPPAQDDEGNGGEGDSGAEDHTTGADAAEDAAGDGEEAGDDD